MALGEEAALGVLYDQLGGLLFSLARRITGNDREAEEVVQDVFLTAWKHASDFDANRSSPKTWLTMLARNKSIDRVRMSRRRLPPAPSDFISFKEVGDTALSAAYTAERAEAVIASVAELPASQRQVVELAFFDGLTHPEISALLNETIGTVKSRIRLGLDRLRKSPHVRGFSVQSSASALRDTSDARNSGPSLPHEITAALSVVANPAPEPNKL